jgi:hypothetical protein
MPGMMPNMKDNHFQIQPWPVKIAAASSDTPEGSTPPAQGQVKVT